MSSESGREMKLKWILMYLDMAKRASEESHAKRMKVGCIFVSFEGAMSIGINGMPAGGSNECEIEVEESYISSGSGKNGTRKVLITKPEVSHAELNCIQKLLRQGVSTVGGKLFITLEPCKQCANIILGSGIRHVFYSEEYAGSNGSGVKWLKENNIYVEHITKDSV